MFKNDLIRIKEAEVQVERSMRRLGASMRGRRAVAASTRVLAEKSEHSLPAAAGSSVKRALDIVLALAGIVTLAPLLVIVAIAIKLDSAGPVIFRQRRTGLNGSQFLILKFRTMKVLEDGPAVKQAQRGDDRVTRAGQFLRRSSIDELPQLFNVLKGEMSMVGPRPHALAHDLKYKALIDKYAFRYDVKPGITGWAQVSGQRGETQRLEQMANRVTLDLWYINNWWVGLDLYILLKTCFEVMRNRAY